MEVEESEPTLKFRIPNQEAQPIEEYEEEVQIQEAQSVEEDEVEEEI